MLYRTNLGSEPLKSFLREYYLREVVDGPYQLDECVDCSLVFHRFIADDALLAELYSDWLICGIDDPYRRDLTDFKRSRDGHEIAALAAFLGKARLKVLDYGTGWGLWPIIAHRLGHDAYATELAPRKADWVSDHGVKVISDSELAGHRFDVINLEQTLEHLPEPRELLRMLTPVLAGVLKASVPAAGNIDGIVSDLKRGNYSSITPVMPLEHVNAFTPRSLKALTSAMGLREVRPSIRQRYSFIWGGGLPANPKRFVKEVVRPLVTFHTPSNLYRWYAR